MRKARPVSTSPTPDGVDLERLRPWFAANVPGYDGAALAASLIAGGRSNLTYVVTDGYVDVPTSVIFTVSGRNDLPTVSGAVQGGTVTPQSAPVVMNTLGKLGLSSAMALVPASLGLNHW